MFLNFSITYIYVFSNLLIVSEYALLCLCEPIIINCVGIITYNDLAVSIFTMGVFKKLMNKVIRLAYSNKFPYPQILPNQRNAFMAMSFIGTVPIVISFVSYLLSKIWGFDSNYNKYTDDISFKSSIRNQVKRVQKCFKLRNLLFYLRFIGINKHCSARFH
jgi:hypothetical protein